MRTISSIILALLLTITAATASAQRHSRVSIIDFVNEFVAEPEDEFTGAVAEAWHLYRSHRPLPEGVEIEVDTKNGFMSYSFISPDEPFTITMQMCYWNCADGKHKLVAQSVWSEHDGYSAEGQFDGLSFMLYDNATRSSEPISAEELGIDTAYGIGIVSNGYDAERGMFFLSDSDGSITYLTEAQWEEWVHNRPINTFLLPRIGKDILAVTHRGHNLTTVTWRWDGKGFSLVAEEP